MTTHANDSPPKGDAKITRAFHHDLAQWYAATRRDLPWRREPSPYRVTVSEFMCQQTQIATVLPFYARWLQRFPDWQTLAAADDNDVLKHWEGLGYYRRARNLHRLAQLVTDNHGGVLPAASAALQQLPGIGEYTAAAIASIAGGERVAVLDGNVERVLTRVFALPWNVSLGGVKTRLRELAAELLPEQNCGDHNQALMELGALVCIPRNPHCSRCPMAAACLGKNSPEQYPVKTKTTAVTEQQTIAVIISGGNLWLHPPAKPGRWHGFHRLPAFDKTIMSAGDPLAVIKYSITKYRVTAAAVTAAFTQPPPDDGDWLPLASLNKIPLPAPHRKIVQMLNTI